MVIEHKTLKQALQILFIAISFSAVYQSVYAACGPNTWDDPTCALPITINNASGSQNYNINSSYSSPTTPLNVTDSTIGNFSIGQVGTPVTINGSGTAVGVFGSYFGNSTLNNLTINSGSAITSPRQAVYLDATTINGTFTNNGSLTGTGSSPALAIRSLNYSGQSYVNNLINNGTISGGNSSLTVESSASVGTLTNNGSITGSNNFFGAVNLGSAASSTSPKVSISSLINNGTISTSSATGIGVRIGVNDAATIGTLYNYGSISSPLAGIFVNPGASLGTLNNLQGAGNAAGPLTYAGRLPTNYNVIINSLGTYGQLSGVTANGGFVGNIGVSGTTNFGIYSGSTLNAPTLANPTVYASVFRNVPALSIDNTTGEIQISGRNYTWTLAAKDSDKNQIDLVLLGSADLTVAEEEVILQGLGYDLLPDVVDTYNSVSVLAQAIQSSMTMQATGINNSLNYDCNIFDKRNLCFSAGGRFTSLNSDSANTTAALLVAAYRPAPNWRVGAFIDQSLALNTNNISYSNGGALMWGLFGAWSQSPEDKTKLEVKASVGFASNNITANRIAYFNNGFSEPGSGQTTVSGTGAQLTAKYGFEITPKTTLAPYVGGRYNSGTMNAYTEASSSTVDFPLSYNQINNYTTTAIAGLAGQHSLNDKATLFASAGVEKDTNYNLGNLVTTGNSNFIVPMNTNYQSTRATATLGAYYDVNPKERLAINGIYRQEPYQGMSSNTVMVTYTVGL